MAQNLGDLSAGSKLKLNETVSGTTTAVPFIITSQDHFATDTTHLLREKLFPTSMQFHSSMGTIVYDSCTIDTWCTGTYFGYLDEEVQDIIPGVSIATYNNGTLSRKVYLLSGNELNIAASPYTYLYTEGTAISYFSSNSLRIGYYGSTASNYYTRQSVRDWDYNNSVGVINTSGTITGLNCTYSYYPRPSFNLPNTVQVSDSTDGDGCYTVESWAPLIPVWVKVSGTWKQASAVKIKNNGTWVDMAGLKVKVDGSWDGEGGVTEGSLLKYEKTVFDDYVFFGSVTEDTDIDISAGLINAGDISEVVDGFSVFDGFTISETAGVVLT